MGWISIVDDSVVWFAGSRGMFPMPCAIPPVDPSRPETWIFPPVHVDPERPLLIEPAPLPPQPAHGSEDDVGPSSPASGPSSPIRPSSPIPPSSPVHPSSPPTAPSPSRQEPSSSAPPVSPTPTPRQAPQPAPQPRPADTRAGGLPCTREEWLSFLRIHDDSLRTFQRLLSIQADILATQSDIQRVQRLQDRRLTQLEEMLKSSGDRQEQMQGQLRDLRRWQRLWRFEDDDYSDSDEREDDDDEGDDDDDDDDGDDGDAVEISSSDEDA